MSSFKTPQEYIKFRRSLGSLFNEITDDDIWKASQDNIKEEILSKNIVSDEICDYCVNIRPSKYKYCDNCMCIDNGDYSKFKGRKLYII
jgi:hypothetical protein